MNFLVSGVDIKEVIPVWTYSQSLISWSVDIMINHTNFNYVLLLETSPFRVTWSLFCKKREQEASLNAEKDKVQAQADLKWEL